MVKERRKLPCAELIYIEEDAACCRRQSRQFEPRRSRL